jgi:hypothetical protein
MTAPDAAGLTCPLCGYDLRGLAEPRCPECGFRFTWAELADEQRNRHRYLFEHPDRPGRWLPAIWRTYWRDCRPRRFWREVSPTNPVRVRRLLAYWLIAATGLLVLPVGQFIGVAADKSILDWRIRSTLRPVAFGQYEVTTGGYTGMQVSPGQLDQIWPPPASAPFWRSVWGQSVADPRADWYLHLWVAATLILAWPWFTMAALLVFRTSMRQAQVDQRHVLRVAIYGCDCGLLMGIVGGVASGCVGTRNVWDQTWLDIRPIHGALPLALFVVACAAVATYRVGFAYDRYLRFDRPWLAVLSSQVIVVLTIAVLAAVWLAL